MYCPICFNDSLLLKSKGVARFRLNGTELSSSKFLYDVKDKNHMHSEMKEQIVKFFNWYTTFKNRDKELKLEIFTSDFQCKNSCKLGPTTFSLLDILFTSEECLAIFNEVAHKYESEVIIEK